ncbi:hypothetical protein BDY21DRAFT_393880 [Lineolata rhizophorae]|uniref:Peptidase M14 domain-containing protein n=1 Tax=Lineolata rhizophorae TaxID=578093 RepID=A0A6A6NY73_9PEZI|nr:hypothetical protein BDY21DRAFT_393880 [Lineolata rhizophorae]
MRAVRTSLALAASLGATLGAAAATSYSGYKVFRLSASTAGSAEVEDIISSLGLATWENSLGRTGVVDVVVAPHQLSAFESRVTVAESSDITTRAPEIIAEVMHEDLGASIDVEGNFAEVEGKKPTVDDTWFDSYHAYDDHLAFLDDLVSTYDNMSEIVTSGESIEGRNITGIHFWGAEGPGKPAVVFHSTVHAREWITTMVNEYMAYTLLTEYGSDADITGFVDAYDFYIFPVVNPDGFVYTQTSDRMWRKNRQEASNNRCLGRDINRNWPYVWDVPGGSSTDPCSETYRGEEEGDTPEVQGLFGLLDDLASTDGLKLYMDWHSYSQLFMYPYGYSCDAEFPNSSEMGTLSRGFTQSLEAVYGTQYEYGPICNTIYQVSGGSVDYVGDVSGADYSFTAELRDTGRYGFVLPPDQIMPTCVETWAGINYLLQNIK